MEQFTILVVTAELAQRAQLREVSLHLSSVSRFVATSSTQEAWNKLLAEPSDIIIFACSIPPNEIRKILDQVRGKSSLGGVTLLRLVPQSNEAGTNIAATLLSGLHGTLQEPFSVDSLQQAIEIAREVRKKFKDRQDELAAKVLAQEAVRILRTSWEELEEKGEAINFRNQTKQIRKVLGTLDERLQQSYLTAIIEAFPEVHRPEDKGKVYQGASNRIRQKISTDGLPEQ